MSLPPNEKNHPTTTTIDPTGGALVASFGLGVPFIDQTNPGQFLLGKDVSVRWKILRMIEAAGRDVDFARAGIPFISERGSTDVAERPPRFCFRPVSSRGSLLKRKIRKSDRNPRHRLGAGGAPAIGTVTVGLVNRLLGRPKAHLPTVTAAGNGSAFHAHSRFESPLSNFGLLSPPSNASKGKQN